MANLLTVFYIDNIIKFLYDGDDIFITNKNSLNNLISYSYITDFLIMNELKRKLVIKIRKFLFEHILKKYYVTSGIIVKFEHKKFNRLLFSQINGSRGNKAWKVDFENNIRRSSLDRDFCIDNSPILRKFAYRTKK